MRKYFNVDTYLTQLQASSGITGCDAVPVPDIGENQNYIFISYAHQDYKQVYEDLAVMYHAGVRFWYDRGLTAGKDWDAEAKRIIEDPHCVGVIFFLSNNLFLSKSVNQEIDIVRGNGGQPLKNYFCVNLANKAPSHILRNIMRMDDEVLDRAGLDMERIAVLAGAFSDKMTYLPFSDPSHRKDLVNQISAQFNVMDALQPQRGYLILQSTGERIPITEDAFVVGRTSRKCHYSVTDDHLLSVVHFSIYSDPRGCMILDYGSTTGTLLNGKRLAPMAICPLNDGDAISAGSQVFIYSQS